MQTKYVLLECLGCHNIALEPLASISGFQSDDFKHKHDCPSESWSISRTVPNNKIVAININSAMFQHRPGPEGYTLITLIHEKE